MGKKGGYMGGGMPGNMNNLMKQAQKMQRQLEQQQAEVEAKQAELATKEFTAAAGGGAVSVTLNGEFKVLSVKIAPEAVDPEDVETLEDLITAATNEAIKQVQAANDEITKASESAMGNFGGLGGLGGFGF